MDQQVKYLILINYYYYFFFLQLISTPIANTVENLIQNLISHHRIVYKEIEFLFERDHQPSNLTKQLTRSIEVLVCLDIFNTNKC
jgi:hypothetical protein